MYQLPMPKRTVCKVRFQTCPYRANLITPFLWNCESLCVMRRSNPWYCKGVWVVLEKRTVGVWLSLGTVATNYLRKKSRICAMCLCLEREGESAAHNKGGSGSGVECFTLPAKWTSLPVALKQAAGRPGPATGHTTHLTLLLPCGPLARLLVRGRWNLLSCGPRD